MSLEKIRKPVLIACSDELCELAETFSKEPILAVDTEANSLHAYHEHVCLIQFSIPTADFLVDPLALDDLSPLAPIFADPDIEKVFHAAEYDFIILQRDFGFEFTNLFDTMIAARILGWKAVGLGSILNSQYGINLNKRYQRANWGRRPLPPEMQTYAQLDTYYLIDLRHLLKSELIAKERWALAQEDFQRATQVRMPDIDHNSDCFHISGSHDLAPQQLAVLQELCQYRDQVARSLDRPLFKVINNQTLIRIAIHTPQTLDELRRIHGMTDRQLKWHGKKILNCVKRGMQADPPKRERKPRPSQAYISRVENLRQWRKKKARSIGVESDVVLPKDLLYTLAEENPTSKAAFTQILNSVPWRLKNYGEELFHLLKSF